MLATGRPPSAPCPGSFKSMKSAPSRAASKRLVDAAHADQQPHHRQAALARCAAMRLAQPAPGLALFGPRGLVDRDLQIRHLGIDLGGRQHVQPTDQHRAFDDRVLGAVQAHERRVAGLVHARHAQHRALRIVQVLLQREFDVPERMRQAHAGDFVGGHGRPAAAAGDAACEHARVGHQVQHGMPGGQHVVECRRGLERHQHHLALLVAHAHRRHMHPAVGGHRGEHRLEDLVVHRQFALSSPGAIVVRTLDTVLPAIVGPGAHQALRSCAGRSTAQPQSSG